MKKRAIKNTKHRIAKARRIVRRTGDDWAETTNKQFHEANRQLAKKQISQAILEESEQQNDKL